MPPSLIAAASVAPQHGRSTWAAALGEPVSGRGRYPSTSGGVADLLVADMWTLPPETRGLFTEKVVTRTRLC
jgi:hypothetical protein